MFHLKCSTVPIVGIILVKIVMKYIYRHLLIKKLIKSHHISDTW